MDVVTTGAVEERERERKKERKTFFLFENILDNAVKWRSLFEPGPRAQASGCVGVLWLGGWAPLPLPEPPGQARARPGPSWLLRFTLQNV